MAEQTGAVKRHRRLLSAACAGILLAFGPLPLRADIYQWEWINPFEPYQGKRQSDTLCPDGLGVSPEPSANLSSRNLTQAYLVDANLTSTDLRSATLTNASLVRANLTNTSFAGANLTNASFNVATLTDADLADAQVTGASFNGTTSKGFTPTQLYSTASYKAKNLAGIQLHANNLTGWNFADQNLTSASLESSTFTNASLAGANLADASFRYSTLTNTSLVGANLTYARFFRSTFTNADLSDAVLTGAYLAEATIRGFTPDQFYSTASYKARDLTRINLGGNDLAGWNFTGQNLTRVQLSDSTLANANLTDAQVTQTNFSRTTAKGLTAAQLYSTASYKARNLYGINLDGNDLTGWNFAGQNLTTAIFFNSTLTNASLAGANLTGGWLDSAWLTNADLTGANLTGVYLDFSKFTNASLVGASLIRTNLDYTTFTNADLTGADLRGARNTRSGQFDSAITTNMIRIDGTIAGLHLTRGQSLIVRDYNASIPIPIWIGTRVIAEEGSLFRIILSDANWGSTISFEEGIPVSLAGTLELILADGTDPSTLVGQSFQLFNWTGVSPTGSFAIQSPYTWDTQDLYTTGRVRLLVVPEPATLGLLSLASLLVLPQRRREC